MTIFNVVGRATEAEIEGSKQNFIKRLGPLWEEFNNRGGVVTFDFNQPPESQSRISFVFPGDYEFADFMVRLQEYQKGNKAED